MKMLCYEDSENTAQVAELIKQKRELLRKGENKKNYSGRKIAEEIGHSNTHVTRIENGERELSKVKTIYGFARELDIPLNQLVKLYLNLTEEDENWCFCVDARNHYDTNSTRLLNFVKKSLSEEKGYKITDRDMAEAIGCSTSHYCRCKNGKRKFNDIRALYNLSVFSHIPLYVWIRNELGITDEELMRVIDLPILDTRIHLVTFIDNDKSKELKIKLISAIAELKYEDLQVLERLMPAFQQ